MNIPIRKEVIPHIIFGWMIVLIIMLVLWVTGVDPAILAGVVLAILLLMTGYFLWFFRDPDRQSPDDETLVLAAADGRVTSVVRFSAEEFRKICLDSGLSESQIGRMKALSNGTVIRVSIFLSLLDVHVNRTPISGMSEFLGYFPGKRLFTTNEKSSSENQHNAIWISNNQIDCLLFQIVGPVARRVVYWFDNHHPVYISMGERIGMMKFGSRLDLYLPDPVVTIVISPGDKVTAGITPVAILNRPGTVIHEPHLSSPP